MDHASALASLTDAECPVTWASENLVFVGHGTAATVYEHPDDPGLVVRVSDYPDGWFMYASAVLDDDGDDVFPYGPSVEWIGERGGVFFGVAERLSTIDDESELTMLVNDVIAAFMGRLEGGWTTVDSRAPGFSDFARSLNARLDLRPENFMHRNGVLVFNDPYSSIPHAMEADLRSALSIGRGATLADAFPVR